MIDDSLLTSQYNAYIKFTKIAIKLIWNISKYYYCTPHCALSSDFLFTSGSDPFFLQVVTFDMDDTTSMWRVLGTRDTCDVTLWRNPHKKCFNCGRRVTGGGCDAAVSRECDSGLTFVELVWARCNRYSCTSPALPRPGRWLNQGRQCPLEFSNFTLIFTIFWEDANHHQLVVESTH